MTSEYDLDKFRRAVLAKGYTASDVARRAKIQPQRVSRFLRGVQSGPRTARKIAKALGLNLEELVR